jgi:ABC-type Fe3+ transport system substrate-binding protein
MMKEVRNYDDIPLLIDLSGGPVPRTWVNYAGARYGQEIAIGTTAVSAAEWYAFLQTGQFMGMLGGMKGAAEYEALLERNGLYKGRKPASIGMDAQTISHVLIILLIVLGNVGFFVTRKKKA